MEPLVKDRALYKIIQSIDRKLYRYNNALSLLEYQYDCGQRETEKKIEKKYKVIRELLSDPSLRKMTAQASKLALIDPIFGRKIGLLLLAMRISQIENDPDYREASSLLRHTLEELEYYKLLSILVRDPMRNNRIRAHKEIARLSALLENPCRRLLIILNERAREQGYSHYGEAKLSYEELSEKELYDILLLCKRDCLPLLRELIGTGEYEMRHSMEAHDLLFLCEYFSMRKSSDADIMKDIDLLGKISKILGVEMERLPIRIESLPVEFNGACYRVAPGKDVRIVLRSSIKGLRRYHFLLHELGHALYYCYCPVDSELLIDNHLAREIMADLFNHALKEERFLSNILELTSSCLKQWIGSKSSYDSSQALLCARDSAFFLELIKDPTSPFREVWRRVTHEWLNIEDNSGAYEIFDFLHPLDLKSYAVSYIVGGHLYYSLITGGPVSPGSPGDFESIIHRLYRPGNSIDWKRKFGWT